MQAVRLALRGRAGQRQADRRELAAVVPRLVKSGSGSPGPAGHVTTGRRGFRDAPVFRRR
jgi:hypothetical protein